MKTLISVVLMLLSVGFATAQSLSSQGGAPGLVIIESSWRRVARPNPALDDPLRSIEDQDRVERARNEVIQRNRERANAGQEQLPVPPRTVTHKTPANRPSGASAFEYVYEVKISNTGAKKIRELVWQYVLLDPGTRREISRRQFTSKISIRPGQSKKLVGRSPPPAVVSVTQSSKELRDQYSERIEIQRIKYDDGSIWESTSR